MAKLIAMFLLNLLVLGQDGSRDLRTKGVTSNRRRGPHPKPFDTAIIPRQAREPENRHSVRSRQ
jgi:hypothetical protein